jgi:hypothetical protein
MAAVRSDGIAKKACHSEERSSPGVGTERTNVTNAAPYIKPAQAAHQKNLRTLNEVYTALVS